MNVVRRGTFSFSNDFLFIAFIITALWFLTAIFTRKFQKNGDKNILYSLSPYIKSIVNSTVKCNSRIIWKSRQAAVSHARGGEADTIIGKRHNQAIISVMERKSRLSLIYKVEQKTSDQVTEAISRLLLPIKHSGNCLTVTSDNGKEFAGHDVIAKKLGAEFYFTHPYSSFERGLNENTNSSFVGLRRTDEEIIRTIKN